MLTAYAAPVRENIETRAAVTKIDYKKSPVKVSYLDADGVKQVALAKKGSGDRSIGRVEG